MTQIGKPELMVKKIGGKGANVVFTNVRATFVYLDKPQKDIDGNADKGKYSVTAIIAERDFAKIQKDFARVVTDMLKVNESVRDVKAREKAFATATKVGAKGSFFKDGNDQTDKAGKVRKGLADAYTFAATMDAVKTAEGFRPKFDLILRNRKNQDVPEHEIRAEFYSGCFVNLSVTLGAYDYLGNQGVKAYLNGAMKIADGEKLSGVDPFADFAPAEDDEPAPSFDEDEPKKGKRK